MNIICKIGFHDLVPQGLVDVIVKSKKQTYIERWELSKCPVCFEMTATDPQNGKTIKPKYGAWVYRK